MAGSRLEKLGTIFTRMNGLLRSGAVKMDERPIWYDLYEAFPPKYEPRSDRPPVEKDIVNIVYPEDFIRADFYKVYGSPGVLDLSNSKSKSICQIFVDEHVRLQKSGTIPKEELFDATANQLEAKGIKLRRS